MQRHRTTTPMPLHTATASLRTQLTASIRLERLLDELAGLDAELGTAREQAFARLAYPEGKKVEDLDDARRGISYARSDLEAARRSLLRVWHGDEEAA